MTRHHWINVALGGVALVLVAVASYLEVSDDTGDTATVEAAPPVTTAAVPITTASMSSTSSTTSTTSTTLPPTTLPPAAEPAIAREYLAVVVARGPGGSGQVSTTRDILRMIGYGDVRGVNGAFRQSATVVYFADGLQASAEQLALDASLTPSDIAPMSEAPPVAGLADAGLLLYLG